MVTAVMLGFTNAPLFMIRAAITSAAAANIELAINCGVLRTELLEIAGVRRRNVPCVRLAMADWRAADNRVSRASDKDTVGRAGPADDLPTVCAIATGLPSRVSNATIVITFCMIGSPEIGARRYSRRGPDA